MIYEKELERHRTTEFRLAPPSAGNFRRQPDFGFRPRRLSDGRFQFHGIPLDYQLHSEGQLQRKDRPPAEPAEKAKKENIEFRYYFTLKEIQSSEDVFPLEFLHIAHRNAVIAGAAPLPNYEPNMECLRLECERELRGLLVHLRRAFTYLKEDRNPLGFFVRASSTMLPTMYGVYYLNHREYPENHQQIFNDYPALQTPISSKNEKLFLDSVNSYISTVTEIVNLVDTMEVV